VAARGVTGRTQRDQHPLPPRTEPETSAQPLEPDGETVRAWREVLRQLISQPRPGYLHFEKAHAVVLERNDSCARCHREPLPLTLTAELLDRRTLSQACAYCHGGVKE